LEKKKKHNFFIVTQFLLHKKSRKEKEKIEKQNSRGMKKAQKISQVGGEGSK
jgi:hypothetical protein